jgi:hypothetical protein
MKKPAVKSVGKLEDAVFHYVSQCCNVLGTKAACVRPKGGMTSKEAETNSLGSWRCTQCGKPCKVSRIRAKKD